MSGSRFPPHGDDWVRVMHEPFIHQLRCFADQQDGCAGLNVDANNAGYDAHMFQDCTDGFLLLQESDTASEYDEDGTHTLDRIWCDPHETYDEEATREVTTA